MKAIEQYFHMILFTVLYKSYMISRTRSTYVFKSLDISSNLLKIIMASAVSRVLENQQVDYIYIEM